MASESESRMAGGSGGDAMQPVPAESSGALSRQLAAVQSELAAMRQRLEERSPREQGTHRSLQQMQRQKLRYDWGTEVPALVQGFKWQPLAAQELTKLMKGVPDFDPPIKVAQVHDASVLKRVKTPGIKKVVSDLSVKLCKVLIKSHRAVAGV